MKRYVALIAVFMALSSALVAQETADLYSIAEEQYFNGQYGAAIRTALEGLQQAPAKDSEESAVELYSILGASYSRMGAFDKAADFFFRCYQYDKKEGNQEGMTSSLINLASMYVYLCTFTQGNLNWPRRGRWKPSKTRSLWEGR